MRQVPFNNITGIILAGGASERMGTPKALLEIDSTTLLVHQVERLRSVGICPITVVVGCKAEEIINAHPNLDVTFAINKNWMSGSFSSLKTGIESTKDLSNGIILLPIDVPGVPVKIVRQIIDTAENNPSASAIIPEVEADYPLPLVGRVREGGEIYNNDHPPLTPPIKGGEKYRKGGHPIWLSSKFCAELKSAPADSRLDELIHRQSNIIRIKVDSPEILRNINTPEDWKKFKISGGPYE